MIMSTNLIAKRKKIYDITYSTLGSSDLMRPMAINAMRMENTKADLSSLELAMFSFKGKDQRIATKASKYGISIFVAFVAKLQKKLKKLKKARSALIESFYAELKPALIKEFGSMPASSTKKNPIQSAIYTALQQEIRKLREQNEVKERLRKS